MMRTSVAAFVVLAGCVSGALGQDYQSLVRRPDSFVGFIVSFRGKAARWFDPFSTGPTTRLGDRAT
jgi:hypothetical protein